MWWEIFMNFIIKLFLSESCINIMMMTNRLSKNVIFILIKNIEIKTITQIFITWVYQFHELFNAMITDRDTQFTNYLWKQICQLLNIIRKLLTAWYLKTDESTERMNVTLKAYLYNFTNYVQNNWTFLFLCVKLVIHNRDFTTINISLFFLTHDYHVDLIDFFFTKTFHIISDNACSLIFQVKVMLNKLKTVLKLTQTLMTAAQQLQEKYVNVQRDSAEDYCVNEKVWLDLCNVNTNWSSKKLNAQH